MAEYVSAEVIEPPAILTEADKWLESLRTRSDEECAKYGDPGKMGGPSDRKKALAGIRNFKKALVSERTEGLFAIKAAIKDLEAASNDALRPLTMKEEELADAVKADDDEWRAERKAEIADMFAEMAPYLVEHVDTDTGEIHDALVDVDTLIARYGNEKGAVWLNRTNIQVVRMALKNAVYDIREGERAIGALVDERDQEEAKARYFATLDLDGTIADMKRIAAQRERVRMLEIQRELEAENPQPTVETNPQPVVEGLSPYVIELPPVSRGQMIELAAWLNDNGITGGTIYAGTLEDAYRKKVGNGR